MGNKINQINLDKLQFNNQGLIPAIAQDYQSKQVLMLAWMSLASLQQTIATGYATYFSRSRQQIWVKGATSSHYQIVKQISIDCDYDCLLLLVEQQGPACHTGSISCFTASPPVYNKL